MYYKILKNKKVIDLLTSFSFVRYCPIRNSVINCGVQEANGIISSDGNFIWHLLGLRQFPVGEYDTVEAIEIDKDEYDKLKALNGKTPEEIIDNYTLYLIEEGLL